MKSIKLNHNYTKVKGAVLILLVAVGGALGNMLINAEDYFDLYKAAICLAAFVILVFLYVHLEREDPELEDIKSKLGPAIRQMEPEDELKLSPIDKSDSGDKNLIVERPLKPS